jgi:hypothetical protein
MTIRMNDSPIVSVKQIKEFLKVNAIKFTATSRKETYEWLSDTLTKFRYFSLTKGEKIEVKQYLITMTGYSHVQLKRLIAKKSDTGVITTDPGWGKRHSFPVVYTPGDIALLSKMDNAHGRISGPATIASLRRMYEMYRDARFVRLKDISVGQLYNLRGTKQYISASTTFTKTQAVQRSIGIRKKPDPAGQPGYLRVDTVHQGDLDKVKGVYHLNLVDEVTQWEVVVCVQGISEQWLKPALEATLAQFPFRILGFHSDNGSEYINRMVAKLLTTLLIEQTKSRSYKSGDNALIEGKNGSIIRKHMGHSHIPQEYADVINMFYLEQFNPYLNFHRPCAYATVSVDEHTGKRKKHYKLENYATPFQKLQTLNEWTQYLTPGVTKQSLDDTQARQTDLEAGTQMREAKRILFKSFKQ